MMTWLVTRNPLFARDAMQVSEGTNIINTSDVHPHLGIPLETQQYADEFIAKEVEQ